MSALLSSSDMEEEEEGLRTSGHADDEEEDEDVTEGEKKGSRGGGEDEEAEMVEAIDRRGDERLATREGGDNIPASTGDDRPPLLCLLPPDCSFTSSFSSAAPTCA